MIQLARFTFNHFGTNCYLLWAESGEALVVDACCGNDAERQRLLDFVEQRGLKPVMAVLTHAHPDHLGAVAFVKERYNIPLALHSADAELLAVAPAYGASMGFNIAPIAAEIDLAERKTIELGESGVEVIHTPGHSKGGVCLYAPTEGILISGDTLFAGSIGPVSYTHLTLPTMAVV